MNPPSSLLIAAEFVRARWRGKMLRGAALTRYQERLGRETVAFAWQHSPFYRRHWSGQDLCEWRTLPPVDKQLMMDHFDEFNTRGIARDDAFRVALAAEHSRDFRPTLDGVTVGLSSGTSGHRGLFLVSPAEQATWAGFILARALTGFKRGGYRVAFFLRSNSNLYQQTDNTLIRLRYLDLMLPIPDAITTLNDLQPHLIVAPPALLSLLAEQRRAGHLRAQPERLISVAEVLEPQDRAQIEQAFGAPVHQIYQCTEGLLGVSCARGSLHIQEDLVALQFEPLDGTGERVRPIITDLRRRTQPIIRYRLDDILQLDPQPCACGSGFRVIRSIEGRSDDLCYFESVDGGVVTFFPDTIRRMILLATGEIQDYQVFQQERGSLCIHLQARPDADFDTLTARVRTSVALVTAQYHCRVGRLTIEPGLRPVPLDTKRRRVRQLS